MEAATARNKAYDLKLRIIGGGGTDGALNITDLEALVRFVQGAASQDPSLTNLSLVEVRNARLIRFRSAWGDTWSLVVLSVCRSLPIGFSSECQRPASLGQYSKFSEGHETNIADEPPQHRRMTAGNFSG